MGEVVRNNSENYNNNNIGRSSLWLPTLEFNTM